MTDKAHITLPDPSPADHDASPDLAAQGYWTEEQTAKFLGKSVATLRTKASRREGPPRIAGCRPVLYKISSVLAWLDSQEVDPAAVRGRSAA